MSFESSFFFNGKEFKGFKYQEVIQKDLFLYREYVCGGRGVGSLFLHAYEKCVWSVGMCVFIFV